MSRTLWVTHLILFATTICIYIYIYICIYFLHFKFLIKSRSVLISSGHCIFLTFSHDSLDIEPFLWILEFLPITTQLRGWGPLGGLGPPLCAPLPSTVLLSLLLPLGPALQEWLVCSGERRGTHIHTRTRTHTRAHTHTHTHTHAELLSSAPLCLH